MPPVDRFSRQRADAFGKHAVVVADQDPQGIKPVGSRLEAVFLKSAIAGTQP
jgi:hypothetical protein